MSSKIKVGVVDYESGNTRSVVNAIEYLEHDVVLSSDKTLLSGCSHIILPGVGSFKKAMDNLSQKNLIPILQGIVLKEKRYFLGICVGMQILARSGEEFGEHAGLGWIEGKTRKLDISGHELRLPHIGWNEVTNIGSDFTLFNGLSNNPTFYFVHSYALCLQEALPFSAYSNYGNKFLAAVQKETVFGVQFHPEKSQRDGLKLLNNFCNLK